MEKKKFMSRSDNEGPRVSGRILPLLLANKYKGQDPTGWWMSEKLDGVRAYWNGKILQSRNGNPFVVPQWFTADFPTDVELDGELFLGRGLFDQTSGIVRNKARAQEWEGIIFWVFDSPNLNQLFEGRMAFLNHLLRHEPAAIRVLPQTLCESLDHLNEFSAQVIANGGEGVMLRQPQSQYIGRRSNTLLKWKLQQDMDAVVVGHVPIKGRNVVGALQCTNLSGENKFQVGSGLSDHDRIHPPPLGSVVVIKFQELTQNGVPRFPVFVGVRADE